MEIWVYMHDLQSQKYSRMVQGSHLLPYYNCALLLSCGSAGMTTTLPLRWSLGQIA